MQTTTETDRATTPFFNAEADGLNFDIMRTLPYGNALISVTGLRLCMALAVYGSNGRTYGNTARALAMPASKDDLAESYKIAVDTLKGSDGVTIESANSVWVDFGLGLFAPYRSAVEDAFKADCRPVNLSGDPTGTAASVNKWCSDKTRGMIDNVITPEGLVDVSMLLCNALYFKGAWAEAFDKASSFDGVWGVPVDITGMQPVRRFMQANRNDWRYAEDDNAQLVVIPYKGGRYNMTVTLPKPSTGGDNITALRVFEAASRTADVNRLAAAATPRAGLVQLPTFKMKYGFNALDALIKTRPEFAVCAKPGADFTGICPVPTHIGAVNQNTAIDVTEEGTEAAAFTDVSAVRCSAGIRTPARFTMKCTRPFLFTVTDGVTNEALFFGRVTDPTR